MEQSTLQQISSFFFCATNLHNSVLFAKFSLSNIWNAKFAYPLLFQNLSSYIVIVLKKRPTDDILLRLFGSVSLGSS